MLQIFAQIRHGSLFDKRYAYALHTQQVHVWRALFVGLLAGGLSQLVVRNHDTVLRQRRRRGPAVRLLR